MNLINESLLITQAPTQILVGLGLYFTLAATVLFCQAVEQGVYPGLRGWLSNLPGRCLRHRQKRQRWVYSMFGGNRRTLPA